MTLASPGAIGGVGNRLARRRHRGFSLTPGRPVLQCERYHGLIVEGNSVKVKLGNLRVAPAARLVRSEPLEEPGGRRRAELSVTGMICSL